VLFAINATERELEATVRAPVAMQAEDLLDGSVFRANSERAFELVLPPRTARMLELLP
jgi:hypothetical protein